MFAGEAGNYYTGLGHVERFPDYWERLLRDKDTQNSVFLNIKPEKTIQFDVGMG